MGEEFYCVLKLVSGEEILSLIMTDENDGDMLIILQNPAVVKIVNSSKGSFIKIKPWIEVSTDDFFIIRMDKIITMSEVKDQKLINIYNEYIEESSNTDIYNSNVDGHVKPSPKMGYIGSVEDARKNLEKIFKDLKES
jgi:hypothetical protein